MGDIMCARGIVRVNGRHWDVAEKDDLRLTL
jgi:hypothetical protein